MRRPPLLPIFLTVFVDVLGLTLVLPLLPFYALHFGASPFVVGCLSATFAVCQLVSGPILGRISDQVGRKPTLLASQFGTFLGFLMLGFAQNLPMLFLSRIIDGATAGNLSIAQAYISDATKPEERTRAFGFIGIAFGTGFLIGPAVSGWLAHHHGYAAPAFAAAGLSALSIVLTATMLPNQLPSGGGGAPRRSLDFGRFFRRAEPRQRLLEFFAFTTSFSTLIGGLAVYLKVQFDFDVERTGYVYALSGLVGAAVQGGIIGRLARTLGESRLSLLGFGTMAAGYLFLGAAHQLPVLVAMIVVAAFGSAVTRPTLTALLTRSVGPDEQGAVLGVSQSLSGISQILGPVLAGFLLGRGWVVAYGVAAGSFALVGAFLVARFRAHSAVEQA
jgi:DHA1 family tetracycline resistance protein-like MFS transporter